MKPRLRWYGIMWADPARLVDAWRYWRVWYETGLVLGEAAAMRADTHLELIPRGTAI